MSAASPVAKQALRVIFLGAPGVGKGSFANKIGPKFGIPVISTGDLVRCVRPCDSRLGRLMHERRAEEANMSAKYEAACLLFV